MDSLRWRRAPLLIAVVLLFLPAVITATADMGVNEGGYLMCHADASIEYDPAYPTVDYYINLFPAGCPEISPDSCGYYRMLHDCHYGDELHPTLSNDSPSLFGQTGLGWICAVFPDTTCVELHVVEFGMQFVEGAVEVFDWGHDALHAFPHVMWPGNVTGIRMVFDPPKTSHVIPLVWFAARTDAGNGRVWVGPYPEHGQVLFYAYGSDDPQRALRPYPSWGFNLAGSNPSITIHPFERVCCVGFLCSIAEEQDCQAMGGIWLGYDIRCDPNPCDLIVPHHRSSWGTIKSLYRTITAD